MGQSGSVVNAGIGGVPNLGKENLFAVQNTAVSVGGTAVETTLATFTVPGGTLGLNGILEINSLWSCLSSANNKTTNVKFGGTTFLSQSVTTGYLIQSKTIIRNRNSAASQVAYASSLYATFGNGANALVTATVNTAVDQTVLLTGTTTTETPLTPLVSLTQTAGTATATYVAHGYIAGQYVLIAGANQAGYNGSMLILTVPTADTFTFAVDAGTVSPATGVVSSARYTPLTLESVYLEIKA